MLIQLASSCARVLALALFVGVGAAQGVHKDARLGFELRAPSGWTKVPMRTDEAWIVAKYRSDKAERVVDPDTHYTLTYHPELRIIAFLDDAEAQGKKGYRDYKAYMRDTYSKGYFFEEEAAGTHGELPVMRYRIKVEGQSYSAEKTIVTWVFDTDFADIAVQLEVTANAFKKKQTIIKRALKSFGPIPRTEEFVVGKKRSAYLTKTERETLTPAARKQRKLDMQQEDWELITRDVPEGWTAKEIDGVFVLNHVDDKFGKRVVQHVRAVMDWLDETLPEVGPEEYARTPIVRICESWAEESSFRSGSTSYFFVGGAELVTHKSNRNDWWEWDSIGRNTLGLWFKDRDPELWYAMPRWLKTGLNEVMESARSKGSRLEFDEGKWEGYSCGDLRGADDLMAVDSLLTMTSKQFSDYGDRLPWCQSVLLTRFLVNARSKKDRQILSDYLISLRAVLDELEPVEKEQPAKGEGDDEKEEEPKTEEEEERLLKERKERRVERERVLLERTFARTFAGWDRGDWKRLKRQLGRSL